VGREHQERISPWPEGRQAPLIPSQGQFVSRRAA
jgi:hypothetical protein